MAPAALCKAVPEMVSGLYEADRGGGLLKKRIGRPGQGKSGGYRTLVATHKSKRRFFLFGFPKNERSNIDKDEEAALQALGKASEAGTLIEVKCDEED